MRAVRSLAILILAMVIGGALLAPLSYWAIQWLAHHWTILEPLANYPLNRHFSRILVILAIIAIIPYARGLGIKRWKDLGLSDRAASSWLWQGLVVGLITLGILAVILSFSGTRAYLAPEPWNLTRRFSRALIAAIFVAVMEETLFRGALFGGLRRRQPWLIALILSSTLFACGHFFGKFNLAWTEPVEWNSGIELLSRILRGFGDPLLLFPGGLNMLLVGIILGLAYQKTGSLFFSIGLHAGWIFFLKMFSFLSKRGATEANWVWGTGRMMDGIIATPVLIALIIYFWRRRSVTNPVEKETEPATAALA